MKDLSRLQHFIGCDVSKDTLDFAIYEHGKDYRQFEHICVSNDLEGFQAMRKWVRTYRIKMSEVVIGMEYTGSYTTALCEWCFKKGITFVCLHPMDVKNACSRGRSKTDRQDAQFIADYIYTMREKLTPSTPEPTVIKCLRQLRNERQLTVRTRTAYKNQIKSATDSSTIHRLEKMVKILTEQVKAIEEAVLKEIASDEKVSRNYNLLISIPGIALVNALFVIVATGNFTKFQNARQFAKFSCVSPLSNESGSSVRGGSHVRRTGHNEIKAILTEAARSAIVHNSQLKAYYTRKKAEGKSYGCVMNAVKFKLICRMFAVIQRDKPYVNTEKYRG